MHGGVAIGHLIISCPGPFGPAGDNLTETFNWNCFDWSFDHLIAYKTCTLTFSGLYLLHLLFESVMSFFAFNKAGVKSRYENVQSFVRNIMQVINMLHLLYNWILAVRNKNVSSTKKLRILCEVYDKNLYIIPPYGAPTMQSDWNWATT